MTMLRAQVVVPWYSSRLSPPRFSDVGARTKGNPGDPFIYSYHGADREQKLVAKAREEGTLTLYTSMATTESAPLAQAFEKKYGVKVQLWRALSENVLQRALTEARGQRRSLDVVETNAPEVEALAREQVVGAVRESLSCRSALLGCSLASALVQRSRQSVVTGYNTAKVKREELPTRLKGSPIRSGRAACRSRRRP